MSYRIWPVLWAPLVALLLSGGLTFLLSRHTSRWRVLDRPNERSLHTSPTPRTGGLAIVAAILCGSLLAVFAVDSAGAPLAWLAAGVAGVAAISFMDDRAGVSPWLRLVIHFSAAAVLLLAGYMPKVIDLPGQPQVGLVPGLALGVSMLFTVWMINLYNFMDGMDGFAGGMAVVGFGSLALLGVVSGQPLYAMLNMVIAAAALGFLLFNFPPARIFMGDVGSSTLGFLAAAMGLWGITAEVLSFAAFLLLFSPFILDATATLMRRAVRGERVWEAHKTHYYQRLVELGWGHRKTVLAEYALMLGCAVTVWYVRTRTAQWQWLSFGAWALVYAALAWWVNQKGARARAASSAE